MKGMQWLVAVPVVLFSFLVIFQFAALAPSLAFTPVPPPGGVAGAERLPLTFAGGRYFPSAECEGCQSVYATLKLNYTVSQDFGADGRIRLYLGYRWQNQSIISLRTGFWTNFRLASPTLPGYSTVVGQQGQEFTLFQPNAGDISPIKFGFEIRQANNSHPFRKGEVFSITLGERGLGSPGYQLSPRSSKAAILVEEQPSAGAEWHLAYPESIYPVIEVGGFEATRFKVVAPSMPAPGEAFTVRLQALQNPDKFGTNSPLVRNYTGTVRLRSAPDGLLLPDQVTFAREDGGVLPIEVRASRPGDYHILAWEEDDPAVNGTSNAIIVASEAPFRIYWGAIHSHSSIGGHALETTDFAYRYARDVEGLEFFSMSEHCANTTAFDWTLLQGYDQQMGTPSFIAFNGYEWTSKDEGHRNVLLFNTSAWPTIPCDRAAPGATVASTIEELLQALSAGEAMAIPHHTAWRDFGPVRLGPWLDNRTQPNVETYSWHGDNMDRNTSLPIHHTVFFHHPWGLGTHVREMLANGYRLGFLAGTDNHIGRPGSSVAAGSDYYSKQGLTGVYARNYTRAGIWEALVQRRTFATTGGRLLALVTSEGHFPGEAFATAGDPTLDIVVLASGVVEEVAVYKNGVQRVATFTPGTEKAVLAYTDPAVQPGETANYHVQILQRGPDGSTDYAWVSPLWITRQ